MVTGFRGHLASRRGNVNVHSYYRAKQDKTRVSGLCNIGTLRTLHKKSLLICTFLLHIYDSMFYGKWNYQKQPKNNMYQNYQFRTYRHLSTMKKELKGEDIPRTWQGFHRWFVENCDPCEEGTQFETIIFTEEFQALNNKPQFYFVEDVSTCNIIQKGKFSSENLVLEHGVKFVSFPKEMRVNGLPAMGCMVTHNNFFGRHNWHHGFFNFYGVKAPEYETDNDGYLSVTYQDPKVPALHCRLNIPQEKIADVLVATTTDEMLEAIDFEVIGNALTKDEIEYQMPLVQLAIKSLVYAQAMPEKCIDKAPPKKATPIGISADGLFMKPPYEQSEFEAAPTVVGYHWRQLRHEKYYKNEHKNKKIGTRWTFIPPYERGLKSTVIT